MTLNIRQPTGYKRGASANSRKVEAKLQDPTLRWPNNPFSYRISFSWLGGLQIHPKYPRL